MLHNSERELFKIKMVASFIDNYKEYFENNDIDARTADLVHGLDSKSVETVNMFIARYKKFIAAYEVLGDDFFINPKDFLSVDEKHLRPIPEKYIGKIAGERYEDNVFINHCGLRSINRKAREKIKGRDIIDGGAFVGDSALVFSEYRPNKIYCFEPTEKNRKMLDETIGMNDLGEMVSVVNMALGDKSGEGMMSVAGPGSTLLTKDKKQQQPTQITTIDEFVIKNDINLGVIKLDIEGYEYNAIVGALESIKKYQPILLIALYHSGKDFFEIKPMIENLGLDYDFKIVKENNTLFYEISLLAFPKPKKK